MQAGRLIDFINTFGRKADRTFELPATAFLLDLLNQAQDEMSAETGMPAKYLTVTNQSSPFDLPSDARNDDPLLEIRYKTGTDDTVLLPQYSIERAGLIYPDWQSDTDASDPEIAIYSTAVDSIPQVYVYPDPGVADYYILYKVKPTVMDDLSDEPFNGDLDRFHVALAHYVAYWLTGDDQEFATYRNFVQQMSGVRNRGPKVARNAAYRMMGRYYA